MEIADAVLTLRTDDAPLRSGLDQAELRIRESLARMERAVAEVGVDMDDDGAAAVAAAINALAILGATITTTGGAAIGATARLAFLTTAAQTLGATSLIVASTITGALAQIQSSLAVASAATAALSARNEAAAAADDTSDPLGPPLFEAMDPITGLPAAAAPAPARALIGALHVTVERESPRAIQAGIERALVELAQRADLAGATD